MLGVSISDERISHYDSMHSAGKTNVIVRVFVTKKK